MSCEHKTVPTKEPSAIFWYILNAVDPSTCNLYLECTKCSKTFQESHKHMFSKQNGCINCGTQKCLQHQFKPAVYTPIAPGTLIDGYCKSIQACIICGEEKIIRQEHKMRHQVCILCKYQYLDCQECSCIRSLKSCPANQSVSQFGWCHKLNDQGKCTKCHNACAHSSFEENMNGTFPRFQKDEVFCVFRKTCEQCDMINEDVLPHVWHHGLCIYCGYSKDQGAILTDLVREFKSKCLDLVATEVDKLLVALKPLSTIVRPETLPEKMEEVD